MEKIRKERLAIYMAKSRYAADIDVLKVEGAQTPVLLATLDGKATLYVKKDIPKPPPPWTKIFSVDENVPEGTFGKPKSVGAALLIRDHDALFVLTFGTGHHLLKTEAVERDFGLRVTLNSVDPDKLRSLDKASYEQNPLNWRTQSTKDVDIFDLEVDSEMEILYAVTGISKEPIFGTTVTGRDALTLMVETDLPGISRILKEARRRHGLKLPLAFEWVDKISRVKNSDDIEILDLELEDALSQSPQGNIWLGEPEIVNWEDQIGYSFDLRPKTPRHVLLRLEDLLKYLSDNQKSITVDALKAQPVYLNNAEYQETKYWSAYRCLYAELNLGSHHYILRNGSWFQVEDSFAKQIDNYLSSLTTYPHALPIYAHDTEGLYNEHVAQTVPNTYLMDKNNIGIGGPYDKLEFCDLIYGSKDLIHVKYYRSSATLSHLFSQGAVAAEAFISESDFRVKLNNKLPQAAQLKDPKLRPNPADYQIVYAIATDKSLPLGLPFFSKVTLKNAARSLRALDFKVSLAAIGVDPAIKVKKKQKPNKAAAK